MRSTTFHMDSPVDVFSIAQAHAQLVLQGWGIATRAGPTESTPRGTTSPPIAGG